ncbi:DNA mismatch repair protein MSH5 [Euphorbia peplus]|nr:DNA mismatch repair protein MSH5 [Euphorbia peplus]
MEDTFCRNRLLTRLFLMIAKVVDDGRIHMITGPNYSGESIKQAILYQQILPLNGAKAGTPRSLCLLDEFGKGTPTEDGVGLLGGAINHFVECDDPPKVFVCTHLTELFSESCLPKDVIVHFLLVNYPPIVLFWDYGV